MGIVIFHPSVAPFVQQAARALYEAGALERFVVTVRDNPQGATQRAICALSRLAGRDLAPQFRRRAVTEVPLDKVESHPWGELLRLLTSAVDRDGRPTDFVWELTETGFDRRVARTLRPNLRAVYGFEHSALASFQRARELGVASIYDVPAPEARFTQNILDAEIDKFPELRTPLSRHTARRDARRIARRRAEWECANMVIAASKFTSDSYAQAGLDASKVRIVPYGAPPVATRDQALRPAGGTGMPPTFLWAGTFSIRKGAHYLLEAWRRGGFGRHAKLKVFGGITLPPRLMQSLPEGVEIGGSIPRAMLMEQYRQADALIFPTLCDGFGMVVTEAWSRGLPVITTERAGAVDLLKPNQNGLVIRAGDEEAIREVLDWAVTHRRELDGMRENSLATAAGWQWSDYRRGLAEALRGAGVLDLKPALAL
jgi:glycosyltransferase involved in cell wall biosynthesis